MTDELERLVAEIPAELKALVDADQRTNKQIVESALWREFGGERQGAIERRIDEKERRISILKSERNEREREIQEHKDQLSALQSKLGDMDSKERQERERVLNKAKYVPADPTHPFVKDRCDDIGMTPEQLAREIADYHGKDLESDDDDDGLNSL